MSINCMTIGNRVTFACDGVILFPTDADEHDINDDSSNIGGFTIDKDVIGLDKRKELQKILEKGFISNDLTFRVYPDHVKIYTDDSIDHITLEIVLDQIDNFSSVHNYIHYPIEMMFTAYAIDRSEIEKIINALL